MPDLDKFYTQKHVSKQCFEFLQTQLNISKTAIYLEPSAGGGAFLDLLPNYIALDIAPEDDRIEEQDYLKYETGKTDFITIGNPPFGKRSKLATDFFNKAASMSEVIAFIVPVSFMTGITGQMFRQFAVCIATSIGLSTVVALTLSPALCSTILKSGDETTDFKFIQKFGN